jgi:hypothetical protein
VLSGLQTVHVRCQTQPLLQLMVLPLINVVFASVQVLTVCPFRSTAGHVLFFFPPRFHYVCMGYAVAQLVEALRYKLEGRGFDSRWCHSHNSSSSTMALGLTQPLTEMSTRNICGG